MANQVFGLAVLVLSIVASASGYVCPTAYFVEPCSCRPAAFGLHVLCNSVKEVQKFRRVFEVLKNYEVDTLIIFDMQIGTIPADLFDGLQIRILQIIGSDFSFEGRNAKPFSGLSQSLEYVDFVNCDIRRMIMQDISFSHLPHLIGVHIENTPVLARMTKKLFEKGPSGIAVITLDNNGIKRLEDRALVTLPNIQNLSIGLNDFSTFDREVLPRPASRLMKLDLSYNNFSTLPEDIFEDMPRLEEIKLTSNKITTLPENTWSRIWNQLVKLELQDNPIHCDDRLLWIAEKNLPETLHGTCVTPESHQNVPLHSYLRKNLRRRRNQ